MDINKLKAAQTKCECCLLKKANVVSVGRGYKIKGATNTKELCLVVGVTKKVAVDDLQTEDLVPSVIGGAMTDVVEVGNITAQFDYTTKHRPLVPGISVGHKNITAGTLGCFVHKPPSRSVWLLSNNHVLANSNDAQLGDAIFQPGPADGGTSLDTAATLYKFVPVQFEGQPPTDPPDNPPPDLPPNCKIAVAIARSFNWVAKLMRRHSRFAVVSDPSAANNRVDAALAAPTAGIENTVPEIGIPTGVDVATLGMAVQKSGRTTGHTTGSIMQVGATVRVSYGTNKVATFVNQLIAGAMSAGGDSGSALFSMDNKVVGLLFAGSPQVTIFNTIQDVQTALDVEVLA